MKQTLTNNERGRDTHLSSGYWTNRKWFTFVALFLVLWIALYFFTHWERSGYAYSKFTTPQIQEINRILYTNNTPTTENKAEAPVAVVEYDTLTNDSIIEVSHPVMQSKVQAAPICDDSCHISKAMIYIGSEFDNKINEEQLSVIRQYISSFSSQEVGLFLSEIKVKVKSYFWLTGPALYLEIVFWVIIGVACSILFAIGNSSRDSIANGIAFNENEIPYQVAKLFYAPFCTIILVLSYNYIKHRTVIEVNTNEGMIVFSFITGLFSGRLMSLLERFKDVLLPEHTVTTPHTAYTSDTHYSGIGVIAPPAQAIARAQNIPMVEEEPEPQAVESKPEDIREVTVELKLDVSGLFEEEKNEIMNNGFCSAVVTLHNVNGKEILTLIHTGADSVSAFVTNDVKPGIYIARSTMTQKLSDNYIINLFGEKTAYITHENNNIELYIKRYEAID